MNDFVYIALLLACCAATAGLVRLCDGLMPRNPAGQEVSKS